jgi:hypothetical protein
MALRQRPVSAESLHANSQKKDRVQEKEQQQPPAAKSPTVFYVFLCAIGLSALYFLASGSPSFGAPSPSLDYSKPYILCSAEPGKVYTVDGKNSQTQCILVDKGYILHTGTLGASSMSPGAS